MGQQPQQFGGGGETYVHPLIALVVLAACVLILILPKQRVILPFLVAAVMIPWDQVIVIGPFHFSMLRVALVAGWIRMLSSKLSGGKLLSGGMNGIDRAFFLLGSFTAVTFVLLNRDSGAFINQLGQLYAAFGTYIFLRFLISDDAEIDYAIRALIYVAACIALLMTVEAMTGHNPYAFFGGARAVFRENGISRDDKARAMGPFGHPILAGCFGAVVLPLFVGLWLKDRKNRRVAGLGIIAASLIVITSNSSTPLLAYVASIFAFCLWPLRKRMRMIRWGLVTTLVTLHLLMKAPVWALIGRIDVTGSSSSYHRFQLVDECIKNFGAWWLIGTKDYANWGWDMWDLANQYVAIADVSGLVPLICFLAVIVYAFKYVGILREAYEGIKNLEWFAWALGAAIFTNVVAFFGISYYDQTLVAWYMSLAVISGAMAVKAAQCSPELQSARTPSVSGYVPPQKWGRATTGSLAVQTRGRSVTSTSQRSLTVGNRPSLK